MRKRGKSKPKVRFDVTDPGFIEASSEYLGLVKRAESIWRQLYGRRRRSQTLRALERDLAILELKIDLARGRVIRATGRLARDPMRGSVRVFIGTYERS